MVSLSRRCVARLARLKLGSVGLQQSSSDEVISLFLVVAKGGNLSLMNVVTGFLRPCRAVWLFVRSWVDGAIAVRHLGSSSAGTKKKKKRSHNTTRKHQAFKDTKLFRVV